MTTLHQRNYSLDIIRITALFLVISVHFLLKSGFYSVPVNNTNMFIMTAMRVNFMICVPLFMILTGYLISRKTISKKYYLKLTKILGIYILASIACILFKIIVQGAEYTPVSFIKSILDFSGANYAWYINMYIGLFLLAPFLNILYKNISSKNHKLLLIFTLLSLTGLGSVMKYVPNWEWSALYPITYYFIGAFIREYPPKSSFKKLAIITIIAMLVNGILGCLNYRNQLFPMGDPKSDYRSILTTIIATLFFVTLLKIPLVKINQKAKKILAFVSDLCLGGYLLSWIFDSVFYDLIVYHEPNFSARLPYFFIVATLVFICSVASSFLINLLYTFIKQLLLFFHKKQQKASAKNLS